jgi:DNA-binding protein HU-beta
MNKQDLIVALAKETGFSQKICKTVVEKLKDVVIKTVSDGEKVLLVDFMTISNVKRAPRTGRNPKSGELFDIPATSAPKVTFSPYFKKSVAKYGN